VRRVAACGSAGTVLASADTSSLQGRPLHTCCTSVVPAGKEGPSVVCRGPCVFLSKQTADRHDETSFPIGNGTALVCKPQELPLGPDLAYVLMNMSSFRGLKAAQRCKRAAAAYVPWLRRTARHVYSHARVHFIRSLMAV
jgi:hypothetical protein